MSIKIVNGIKVSDEFPPVIDAIKATFQINPQVYFTYGDVLHNPYDLPLPDDIIAHEKTHMKQQGDKSELWWGKYLRDAKFRIEQEAVAYGHQYAVFCQRNKDREQRNRFLMGLARTLSGPLYGNAIKFNLAIGAIKHYA